MDTKEILQALARIEGETKAIRALLDTPKTGPPIEKPGSDDPKKSPSPPFFASSLPTKELGPIPDYRSDLWPQAVDPKLIVSNNNESAKQFRAVQIVSLISLSLADKIVLDCGCGEAHNASEIASTATKVVGYDPKQDPNWAGRSKDNLILTSTKQTVAEHAPFDLIVLYDVIDHVVGEDPQDLLKWLAGLLSNNGQIFVRAHPWTSRTGGHVYESANKAFLHLALTPDELAKAGLAAREPNLKVVRPMAAYEYWFKEAGLEVIKKKVRATPVEDFFSGTIVDRIAKINWDGKIEPDVVRRILANHLIDYTLRKV
jgi:SAM-dependent methyltransferase